MIRYEEIIATGGKVLAKIDKDAESLGVALLSNNISKAYDKGIVHELAERLLGDESIFFNFYEPAEIETLFNEWKIK